MKRDHLHIALILLLLASLCQGIGHIALLPPWEGFDETAHYSSIQQIAETGELPWAPKARISREAESYAQSAPMPYGWHTPRGQNKGYTYRAFFKADAEVIDAGRRLIHGRPQAAPGFAPGVVKNWQTQHPPLYYLLMAPVYQLVSGQSLGERLLVMRLVSYALAWLALVAGVWGLLRLAANGSGVSASARWAALGTALWPLLIPSWYPALARLGNDSLCTLAMALAWLVWIGKGCEPCSRLRIAALGIILGLGCLTKLFFLPISAGIAAYLLYSRIRRQGWNPPGMAADLVCLLAPLLAISAWWYMAGLVHGRGLPGSSEISYALFPKGSQSGIWEHLSLYQWLRGQLAFWATWAWSGSWSWARPPYAFLAPVMLFMAMLGAGYLSRASRAGSPEFTRLPLWGLLPVLLGFSFHVLVRIALGGKGSGTGGYYMNFMAAPLGVVMGLGMAAIWPNALLRLCGKLLALYALVLFVVTSWAQVLLYGGIIYLEDGSQFYRLPLSLPPWLGLPLAFERLAVLGFPFLGGVAWLAALVLAALGLYSGIRAADSLAATGRDWAKSS